MKTPKTTISTLGILITLYLSACGGATSQNTTGQTAGSTSDTPSPTPLASSINVPDNIAPLLNSECPTAPTPQTVDMTVNGQRYNYTESLAQQDEGNQINTGTNILISNKVGNIIFKPSIDGKVYWGVRKWVLAPSQNEANSGTSSITMTSTTIDNQAQVKVDHPSSNVPGTRYQTCLIVLAPADWIADISNNTGNITTDHHTGALTAETGAGNIIVEQNGPGFMTLTTHSGNIIAEGDSQGGANIDIGTGNIDYILSDAGVSLQNASRLHTNTGNISFTSNNSIGFHLNAQITTGNLSVSPSYPSPTHTLLGERINSDINGGGANLTISLSTGNMTIH